jgi:hypothetical protein
VLYVAADECCSLEVDPSREALVDHICNKRLYKDEPYRDKTIGKTFAHKTSFFATRQFPNFVLILIYVSFNLPLSSMIHVLCISIHLE